MEWKPAHVADSKLHGTQCSNPGATKSPAVYTFGHPHVCRQAAGAATAKDPLRTAVLAQEDNQAAVWWKGDHKPTTNDARNSDISEFWAASEGNATEAIQTLTGKNIATRVKEAGRGSHVVLGFEGTDFTKTSKYKDEFCQKFEEQGGEAIKPVTSDMYFQAKKNARANKALGTGSSVNLSFVVI